MSPKKPEPIAVPVHKDNVMLITVYIKKGIVAVSYKGQVKTAQFQDNTLRNMVKGIRFRKNAEQFAIAIAQLTEQLIQPNYAKEESRGDIGTSAAAEVTA